MNLAHPLQLLWLVPLTLLGAYLILAERKKRRVLHQFLQSPMLSRLVAGYRPRRALLVLVLRLAALMILVFALAAPEWGAAMIRVEHKGIDVIFAVDCSKSMQAQDLRPNRLGAAKRQLSNLMQQLKGNRFGLIGFAGAPFPFCPLTLDAGATRMFLQQIDQQAVQVPGTAIGDAVRLALRMFPKKDPASKAIVLITDGEDHHSHPLGAARQAASQGVTIYTVGIGTPQGVPIPIAGGGYLRDDAGKVVLSKLHPGTLEQMARITGGLYVHADNGLDTLQPIVDAIGGMERKKLESQLVLRYQQRYQLFVALGLALLVLAQMLNVRMPAGGEQP